MKKLVIVILLISFSKIGFAQYEKFAFSLDASPLLLYKYDKYKAVLYKNKYNYLFGGTASVYIIDRDVDLAFNTGLYLKTKNRYSEYSHIYPTGEPATSIDKYTYLSWPLTLKCEITIGLHYLTFVEGGIFLNWIVSKYYLYQYPDGSTINTFPNDLEYKKLHELYFAMGFGRFLANSKYSAGIKPYLFYKIKNEDLYSHSFYNVGRLGYGISFFYTFYISRKSPKNK